tara:strand:- start:450 stop:740 length:291 start_codon:yes stop_codon:yes gene_type:complete
MLKFSTYKTTGGLNHYTENKDFELEFIIIKDAETPFIEKIWELREYQYGVLENCRYFEKLSEAKAWANHCNNILIELYPDPKEREFFYKEPSWCQF